jgi:5-methylcytosine-specific restriction endonuclease McrA
MPWDKKTPAERQRSNRTYGADWRRKRQAQLERDRWRCQLQLEGCQGAASEVDHILGAQADPNHTALRSVCSSCHKKRTAEQGGGWRKRNGPAPDPPHQARTQW